MGNLALLIIGTSIALALLALSGLVQFPRFSKKLFTSRINRTVGSVKLLNSGSPLNSIAVHILGTANPPEWIGLTIQNGGYAQSEPIMPVTLSVAEARQLSELLAKAVQAA